MSSYIIAGSADSIDTAYCQEIAKRIKAKYSNIDFRIVIKHPSEWEDYLQQICRIYGFLKKSNPIIYTFDGKIIGNRDAFVHTTSKYFGLDEETLIVDNLTNKINMKLAEEEINHKNIAKNNIKTLQEKIDFCYSSLLQKNILKHSLKHKEEFLVKGIEYIYMEVPNICSSIQFAKQKKIQIISEQIVAEDINLMALSLNDQIKPEETLVKEAFVTTNEKQKEKEKHALSEHDRQSVSSRTNKMHESIISNDKESKGVKDSNQTKNRIDEEVDDVPDYVDYPITDSLICELADQFFVAFETKSHIRAEMIFYHSEDSNANANLLRVHSDGRPIKGHHVLIKQIHFDNQNLIEENPAKKEEEEPNSEELSKEIVDQFHNNQSAEKSKTEPNIPTDKHMPISDKILQDDAISEPHTDLNILSLLNYHTLFIHRPLSSVQIKNLMYFIQKTNTVGCLQFLPENPNPRMKLYSRKYLLAENIQNYSFPVERVIEKQLEENEFVEMKVPSEKGTLLSLEGKQSFELTIINDLGFEHYIYELSGKAKHEDDLCKVIKYTVDHILSIEDEVKRDIGYNLIITAKIIMIVPLVEPYQVYDQTNLYLDGLAFLGYVQVPKLQQPFQIKKPVIGNEQKGNSIRTMLAKTTGKVDEQ